MKIVGYYNFKGLGVIYMRLWLFNNYLFCVFDELSFMFGARNILVDK